MNAKSQLAPKGHTPAQHTLPPAPPQQEQQPAVAADASMPEWLPLEGAELLTKAYFVASDDKGSNAVAAIRKASRHMIAREGGGYQWQTGQKWVAFLGNIPLTFTPTHYMDLPDGWMMRT